MHLVFFSAGRIIWILLVMAKVLIIYNLELESKQFEFLTYVPERFIIIIHAELLRESTPVASMVLSTLPTFCGEYMYIMNMQTCTS